MHFVPPRHLSRELHLTLQCKICQWKWNQYQRPVHITLGSAVKRFPLTCPMFLYSVMFWLFYCIGSIVLDQKCKHPQSIAQNHNICPVKESNPGRGSKVSRLVHRDKNASIDIIEFPQPFSTATFVMRSCEINRSSTWDIFRMLPHCFTHLNGYTLLKPNRNWTSSFKLRLIEWFSKQW